MSSIALGYVRRSAKSDERNVSVAQQAERIKVYCEKHSFTLADVVVHDGVSGGKRSRFDAIEMQRKQVAASIVVVYDLDRLARDNPGMLNYLEVIMAQGVQLHETTSGQLDYRTAEGVFMTQVRGAVQEFQRNLTGRKTRHALAYLREQGRRYTNIPPFGYRYVDGAAVPAPEEQSALEMLNKWAASGVSARMARKRLTESGYSGRMGVATLHKLIREINARNISKSPE